MKKFGDNRNFVPKDADPKSGPGRRSMSPEESKRHFEQNAKKTHWRNMPTRLPMRGGIRL